jgi:hypothetical protein
VNFQGPYLGPLRAANRSRAEKAGTDQILRVLTTLSPLVTRLKGPVRGEVDRVLFCHDIQSLQTSLLDELWYPIMVCFTYASRLVLRLCVGKVPWCPEAP